MHAVTTINKVAKSWRPIDDVARGIRRAAFVPDVMVKEENYEVILRETIQYIEGLPEEKQTHGLVIEVKKVVIEFMKVMEEISKSASIHDLPMF